uniref:cytochrome c oxidase subunit II n=1 Tax=Gergithus yunnanensis TaxID=1898278 RepID=UPI002E792766|nr:cytochrome c oxidase subunit II [Gergithus yunnanensis]WQB38532.1 cytochrome c oxidase subunit II [Gergithus yunnanensis]
MPTWMKLNMMNGTSPIMEQLIMFHDFTMMIISLITTMVMIMLYLNLKNKFSNRKLMENQMIETIWTITPAMILIVIALPSLKILYLMEEINNPSITIKTMGHQWFWTYQYSDKKKLELESYMTKKKNKIRLMEVDNRIAIPYNTQTRMIISSSDVIHSWTIPSIGMKMDAVPGRLNQISFSIKKPGIFMGQCSEICGTNHSFMPITLESINMKNFIKWMEKN